MLLNQVYRIGLAVWIFAIPLQCLGAENQAAAPWVGETINGVPCTGASQGYGPFDYLKRKKLVENLHLVEKAHFKYKTEQLLDREHSLKGDLDYTLRAWPNHHRALAAIIRFKTLKNGTPVSAVECYLLRAINFVPTDFTPYMLYGVYLHRLGHKKKALKQYESAAKISPKNPELHYNWGLLLISMKKYDEANNHAVLAYKGGYPLPGLKQKLSKLGYWKSN